MTIDSKNIVNLDLKKDQKVLNFSDFQKQDIKFDIFKLQEAYNQIVKIKKFDDGGGISLSFHVLNTNKTQRRRWQRRVNLTD